MESLYFSIGKRGENIIFYPSHSGDNRIGVETSTVAEELGGLQKQGEHAFAGDSPGGGEGSLSVCNCVRGTQRLAISCWVGSGTVWFRRSKGPLNFIS